MASRHQIAQLDDLGREIQSVLRQDIAAGELAYPVDVKKHEFDGYCAVASAAYFFLVGERLLDQIDFVVPEEHAENLHWQRAGSAAREAGYQPMHHTKKISLFRENSHWWLEGPKGIIDLTLGQEDTPDFPYEKGRPMGFANCGYKRPSDRAKELIRRVKGNPDS